MKTTERKKQYIKEYSKRNKEKIKKYKKEYYKNNIKEKRARDRLWRNMKRKGIKPSKCVMCGSKNNIERHHPNYDKPFYFRELCHSCHMKEHSKLRQRPVLN